MALLAALWLAGLCWHLLRLALGGIGLMRLSRRSAPFTLECGCDVRLAAAEEGPSTFGALRPIVLLPRSAPAWPAARLKAVLDHEMAHVRRRDAASQLLARLTCALYWPNPLLWLALAALRREAEIAADDEVLAAGMMPSAYAAELLELARDSAGPAPGIAMADSALAARLKSVLAENSSRKGVTRMDMAKTVSFGLAATLLLGVARFDIAVAQDVAPPAADVSPRVDATPQVEVNREVSRDVQQRVQAKTDAARAKAEAAIAKVRAKAEAETDPVRREQLRQAADQVAADAARALAHAEEARKAAQDVASAQIRRAMTRTGNSADAVAASRSLAAAEQAEKAARDVAMTQVGDAMRRTAADRVNVREAEQRAQEAMAQMREQARADARARVESLRALEDVGPQVAAAVAKAMADAHVSDQVVKALADVHIDEIVAKAMEEARPAIAAAMARERRAAEAMPPRPPRAPDVLPALPVPPVPPAPLPPPAP
jgi:hypothetical protein